MKIIGEKRFSHDLNPVGMEHPAMYIYRYTNMDMHSKLLKFVREAVERYNKANNEVNSELNTEEKKKKDTSRK